jgi:outer membrane lipoprotein-sorting protein
MKKMKKLIYFLIACVALWSSCTEDMPQVAKLILI